MKTIHKATLNDVRTDLQLPLNAEVLHVAHQNDHVRLWYLCDPASPLEARSFALHPTGGEIPNATWSKQYCGTVFIDWMVWHVFEVSP